MYRQSIRTLEDLAVYLREGLANRSRRARDLEAVGPPAATQAAEIRGEIRAFEKVLQILNNQFDIP